MEGEAAWCPHPLCWVTPHPLCWVGAPLLVSPQPLCWVTPHPLSWVGTPQPLCWVGAPLLGGVHTPLCWVGTPQPLCWVTPPPIGCPHSPSVGWRHRWNKNPFPAPPTPTHTCSKAQLNFWGPSHQCPLCPRLSPSPQGTSPWGADPNPLDSALHTVGDQARGPLRPCLWLLPKGPGREGRDPGSQASHLLWLCPFRTLDVDRP